MTSAHVIYIPMVCLTGMFIGFILGTRAARNSFDLQQKRDAERAAAREARAARKAAGAPKDDGGGSPS
jgi:hypothetical protein